jgi:hypothetical protein
LYHCPANKPDHAFYLRPLAKPKDQVWYAAQPMGRHKLSQVVANMCKQAGLAGHRTNHSLRATAASRLYDEQVDEQLICEVTGHRSNAVRNYKRTTEKLKRKVNAVVQGLSTVDSSSDNAVVQGLSTVDSSSDNVVVQGLSTVDSSSNHEKPGSSSEDQVSCEHQVTRHHAGGKHISLTLNFNL